MRRNDREVKDLKGIEEIILRCRTCRVAMADGGFPYVVPLSFGYKFTDDGALVLFFHSAPEGKKLDILRKNPKVCFELSHEGEPVHTDNPCNSGYYYSSVIGYGEAVFIFDVPEKCEALSAICLRQTGESVDFDAGRVENVCVYKIVSIDYSGKRKPPPAPAG